MSQPRWLSVGETVSQTVAGYGIAVAAQEVIFPLYGVQIAIGTSMQIAIWFLLISIVRGYYFRRFFEWFEGWILRRHS